MYKALGIGVFSLLMVLSGVGSVHAELWDLIIQIDEIETIQSGESVWIRGVIVDHAYKPVEDVEVFMQMGTVTETRYSNPDGEFGAEFRDFDTMPGTYIVNVAASFGELTGLATTQLYVKGEILKSELEIKLSSKEAQYYINSKESDFEKNPIGQRLFQYYDNLHKELIKERNEAAKPDVEQILLDEQRRVADDLRKEAIIEFNPGAGVYNGSRLNSYIGSLDSEVRELVSQQLNFTKTNFFQAQIVRDEILSNGGTYEQAREAYLDMITMPIEKLEEFNKMQLEKMANSTENTTESQ